MTGDARRKLAEAREILVTRRDFAWWHARGSVDGDVGESLREHDAFVVAIALIDEKLAALG